MKMVINGYAGAGTVTMGGYDYHGQGRATGEMRNFRAGRCIGACLEYAARMQKPLMIYVFSDGSLSANGMADISADGRGKLGWAERQPVHRRHVRAGLSARAARPALRDAKSHSRSARYSASGDVVDHLEPGRERGEPAGGNRDPQLHGAAWRGRAVRHQVPVATAWAAATLRDSLTMFAPVCSGTVSNPV